MSSQQGSNPLGGIKTEITVAWALSVVVVVIWAILALLFFYFASTGVNSQTTTLYTTPVQYIVNTYYSPIYGIGITVGIAFVVLAIPSILVLRRTGRMRTAANKADVPLLKKLSSMGWAIVALIFTGVVTGILLLIAHGHIEKFGIPGTPGAQPTDMTDRLTKLKSLLDSGAITKEEFEEQKKLILGEQR
jgi:hypothetical protein